MNRQICLLLAGVAAVAGGCSLMPEYVRPQAPVPVAWPTGAAYPANPAPAGVLAPEQLAWREFITDAKLRQLIETALANNRDLRLAALNVERARALYGIQRVGLQPVVNAVGSAARQSVPFDLSGTGSRRTSEQYGISLGVVSWELDFFGRLRSLRDSALAEYLATEQARRSAQILLVSSVANAYLALAADQEALALAETTLASQQDARKLVQRRHDLGLVPELDLYRAQTQVAAARGSAVRFTQQVAQDENALNLLLGAPAPRELLPAKLESVTCAGEIGPGLPSEILLRRPDVLQAEGLLKAANANIGAARAAFFPRISLTAALGTASSELTGLFNPRSGTWSYAPQAVIPIFDARTRFAYKAANVQREMAVTQYEKAIQSAFKDVADALAARGTVDQQVAAQQALVDATAGSFRLANARYLGGIDSYLPVLDAQRSLFAAQQGLVSLQLAKLTNRVRLYAVLGGWETATPPIPAPASK